MSVVDQIPTFQVLGVTVHLVQMSQVLRTIEQWIDQRGDCRYIVANQMHGIMESRRDPQFKIVLNSADLFVPDGLSLIWAARRRGFKEHTRVPGPDLFLEGCHLATERGYRVFFYGDTEETLEALTLQLKGRFPDLRIVGAYSPPFRPLTPEEDALEVQMINESEADIVWVGLGSPKQEKWMYEHQDRLDVPVLVGVGAAFKFLSGGVKRAPAWVGDHGFEWLWRLIQEPRRVWRRVIIDGPHFMISVMLENLDSKSRGKTK